MLRAIKYFPEQFIQAVRMSAFVGGIFLYFPRDKSAVLTINLLFIELILQRYCGVIDAGWHGICHGERVVPVRTQ